MTVKPRFKNLLLKTAKALASLLFVCLVADLAYGFWVWRSLHVDYSAGPPRKVFQLVMNQDIPSGISNLKIAGHGFMMGHTVWMKFSANDAAIPALLKNKKLTLEGLDGSLNWVTKKVILDDQDALAVGWDKVLQLKHFQSYKYEFIPSGTGWSGEIIIDREHHVVYTYSNAM